MRVKAVTVAVALASLCFAEDYKLGSKVQEIELKDLSGGRVAFHDLEGQVTVVTFISTQCPISNSYNDRMSALYRDYSAKGVRFIFANANRTEQAKDVAEHAKSVKFPFPVYKDENNQLANRLNAQVTPESFVLDRNAVLVYRGQVDDSKNEARVKEKSLRNALDAVLDGKPVAVAETKAFGCTIKRVRRSSRCYSPLCSF
ncbi:MAG: redoxin domain-containing protein [Acidobacteriaceae bacterium]|nr:redoxin domain-containing protein [Acidobacteriaceae bacterium]